MTRAFVLMLTLGMVSAAEADVLDGQLAVGASARSVIRRAVAGGPVRAAAVRRMRAPPMSPVRLRLVRRPTDEPVRLSVERALRSELVAEVSHGLNLDDLPVLPMSLPSGGGLKLSLKF